MEGPGGALEGLLARGLQGPWRALEGLSGDAGRGLATGNNILLAEIKQLFLVDALVVA